MLSFVTRLGQRWVAHDNSRSAAAIGFYAIFTVAPMLVFATAGVGLFIGNQAAQSLTEERLAEAIGPSGARVAQEVLVNANFSRHSVAATAVSAAVLLYASSAVFFQLRKTLDRVFGRSPRTGHEALTAYLLGRLVAALCVIVATGLLVATLIAQVVLDGLSEELLAQARIPEAVWQFAATATTVTIVSLVVVTLLKFLPSQPPAWRHVLLGAMVCVVLFELGKWLIGMYISSSVIASAYGPGSAIVAFILWIFYSTQIFILGAEVCKLSAEGGQSWSEQ
jgi:membrane protein